MLNISDFSWSLNSYGRGRVALKLWLAPGRARQLKQALTMHNVDVSRCLPKGQSLTITAPRSILRVLSLIGALDHRADRPDRRTLLQLLTEYVEAHMDSKPWSLERRVTLAQAILHWPRRSDYTVPP
jgi:hypothetical protein